MDANTPINIPIRLEQWIHDNYMEVETIIIDARTILDATDFDNLPEWEDWDTDFIAEDAQRIGLLKCGLGHSPSNYSTVTSIPTISNGAKLIRPSKVPQNTFST